jgi:ubiquinone/menaquinone biosynthesis C-methylase UbiE
MSAATYKLWSKGKQMILDEFSLFKERQKKSWGSFTPLEILFTMPAAQLVSFAQVKSSDAVLDVGCGTGVVALTAARLGAKVAAIDLCPELLDHARQNRVKAGVDISLMEGDVEALPYDNNAFDVVLSQFGHIFAPRPNIAISEMLRVLKPGGTIAFSTWPPDLFVGRLFQLVTKYVPPPPFASLPPLWGMPHFVRAQLSDHVDNLIFEQGNMIVPALSVGHYRESAEMSHSSIKKLIQESKNNPDVLRTFRKEFEELISEYFENNHLSLHYLMSRARKN